MREEDWAGAMKGIDGIIEANPENPNHYLKKGDICRKAGDAAESLSSYLKAAWYLNRMGFLKKALAVYKMTLRYDPDNDEAIHAANSIMMELESSVQTPGRTPWKEVFAPEETLGEDVGISPDTGLAEQMLHEQSEAPLSQVEEVLEPTRYSEERTVPAVDPTMEKVLESLAGPGPGPFIEPEGTVPLGFLSYFTSDEIGEILRRAELKRFSDGQNVVHEGDTGDSIYVIKSGIAVVVGHFFGKVVQLETLCPGDLFGEVAFLTGRTRTANVTAKGELEVYEINRVFLEELIEKRPQILSGINEIYIKRVRATVNKVRSL